MSIKGRITIDIEVDPNMGSYVVTGISYPNISKGAISDIMTIARGEILKRIYTIEGTTKVQPEDQLAQTVKVDL